MKKTKGGACSRFLVPSTTKTNKQNCQCQGSAINSSASDQALSELEELFGLYWPGLSISSEDTSVNHAWVKHCLAGHSLPVACPSSQVPYSDLFSPKLTGHTISASSQQSEGVQPLGLVELRAFLLTFLAS